jgi:hypothetical protein
MTTPTEPDTNGTPAEHETGRRKGRPAGSVNKPRAAKRNYVQEAADARIALAALQTRVDVVLDLLPPDGIAISPDIAAAIRRVLKPEVSPGS